jgi:hypothetical protein
MPIKNNDDVAHLLEATGRSGSPYREFEAPSDQMSAPLIDAVFAKGPPEPALDAHRPAPLQTGPTGTDLLSEVFEGSPRAAPPPATYQAPNEAPAFGYPQTAPPPGPIGPLARSGTAHPAMVQAPIVQAPVASRRSLNDIRRIIMKPVDDVPSAPTSDGLNGLFDRLAG